MVADCNVTEVSELLSPTGKEELLAGETLFISAETMVWISGIREERWVATRELLSDGELAVEVEGVPAGTLRNSGDEIGTEKTALLAVSQT